MKKLKVEQLVELFITAIIITLAIINVMSLINNKHMNIWIVIIFIMAIITIIIDYALHKIYLNE